MIFLGLYCKSCKSQDVTQCTLNRSKGEANKYIDLIADEGQTLIYSETDGTFTKRSTGKRPLRRKYIMRSIYTPNKRTSRTGQRERPHGIGGRKKKNGIKIEQEICVHEQKRGIFHDRNPNLHQPMPSYNFTLLPYTPLPIGASRSP